ncbi:MAG: EMC3/TMCO1 family protein [Candidatus Bathyarchaeota archaeon]|nr:EMC3/TMCO1 family protein [Candidatus Bathyarchaeota archaeon]
MDISIIPIATLVILGISVALSFMNMTLNRVLISRLIGWNEYRSMQKELAEYNSQRMTAMRANDTKTLEKLKKKESQMNSMQAKMFKPQMFLLPITAIYFVIWPILIGFFPGNVVYIPGLGAQPFFAWYMICAFFFGTIASRVLGTTPIQ